MLRLLTFGTLSLRNGEQITKGVGAQRSRLAILAVVASAGERGVTRDKLIGYFWAEANEAKARSALKQASYALRQATQSEPLITNGTTLRLDPAVITSDVEDFRSAVAAGDVARVVDLYRGPFLDGIYVRNAPEFEQWVETERSQLAQRFAEALDQLASASAMAQLWDDAVKWRLRIAEQDPLSSRAAVALMDALARAGDVSSALQAGRAYDARIAAELESPMPQSRSSRRSCARLRTGTWLHEMPRKSKTRGLQMGRRMQRVHRQRRGTAASSVRHC